jgi:hypothetical protein
VWTTRHSPCRSDRQPYMKQNKCVSEWKEMYFWSGCICLSLNKHFIVVKIFRTISSRIHLDTLCAHASFRVNRYFFCPVYKDKTYVEEIFLALNFIYLHMTQKKSVFHETTLRAHSKHDFFVIFLKHFKVCLKSFWKNRRRCTRVQKRLVHEWIVSSFVLQKNKDFHF